MNPDSLSEVYGKYSKQVYWYALSLCGDRRLAEDITQDCFVKAMLSFSGARGGIRTWLLCVCRNLWIDQLRKNRHRAEMPKGFEAADKAEGILDGIVKREELGHIFKAMDSLPGNMRELIMLDCIMEIPQQEIAWILNSTHGAVRTLLCRTRRALKKKLEENDDGF